MHFHHPSSSGSLTSTTENKAILSPLMPPFLSQLPGRRPAKRVLPQRCLIWTSAVARQHHQETSP